jgi:ABC-type bacteriocin/lantibiotic exporter with double-glycine peptidase domain
LFHGKSRIWEKRIKFDVAKAFSIDLFHKVTSLPMQWHNDHHSGETIDKVNKGMYAIREFSGENFQYLHTVIFAIGSVISLFFLRPKAAIVMILFGVLTFFLITKFDTYIIPLIKIKNLKEHVVMSTLFDMLSNIKTIITLRFESRALATVRSKIQEVFPVYMRYNVLDEWKRFSMDILMAASITLIL